MTCLNLPRWSIAMAALVAAPLACGAGVSVGAGAGVDRGRVDCVATFACDRGSATGKLFLGYSVSEAIDVRAVFFDAGRFRGGGTTPLGSAFGGTFKVAGLGVTGGYRLPIAPSWSVEGRAGLASVRTRFDHATPAVASAAKTTLQPLVGVGLGYAVTPSLRLSLDCDATRFKVHTTRGSLQLLGVTAQHSF